MTLSRRRFLQAAAAAGLMHLAPGANAAQETPALPLEPRYQPRTPSALPRTPQAAAYTFFMAPEARFVEAACARLIPADGSGPGALEAGVPLFIDRQLQGAFGLAAKWYMQGPWGEGSEQQGYQLPLTPQELYRLCLAALDVHAEERYGGVFADLEAGAQDTLLQALENGEVDVEPVPAALFETFWQLLLDNVRQGFFADPAYGGNVDKVGWRLVGFPGVAAAYRGVLQAYYGRPYRVDPVSIADLQTGAAEADASGHAVHRDRHTGAIVNAGIHEGDPHGH